MLCQFSDPSGRATLAQYVDVPGVYPVGRLDADSEGLLLLTDDGALQHRLAEPRFKQPKTYVVQVEGVPDEDAMRRLVAGVMIQGQVARADRAEMLPGEPPGLPPRARPIRERLHIPTAWIRVVLSEGRNRQVRRMTAAVGLPTLRLVRVSVGTVSLGALEPGQWRFLSPREVAILRASCGFTADAPSVRGEPGRAPGDRLSGRPGSTREGRRGDRPSGTPRSTREGRGDRPRRRPGRR